MCEVYLRKYQVTNLEHKVHGREFWKGTAGKLNQSPDVDNLGFQMKRLRCSFGPRWGCGMEHSSRVVCGGSSEAGGSLKGFSRRREANSGPFLLLFSCLNFLLKLLTSPVYRQLHKGRRFWSLERPRSLEQRLAFHGAGRRLVAVKEWAHPRPKNIKWLSWVFTADSDRTSTKNCSWLPFGRSVVCDLLSYHTRRFYWLSFFFPPCQLLTSELISSGKWLQTTLYTRYSLLWALNRLHPHTYMIG